MFVAAGVEDAGVEDDVCWIATRAERMAEVNWLDGVELSGLGAWLEVDAAPKLSIGRFCPVNEALRLLLVELPLAADCSC